MQHETGFQTSVINQLRKLGFFVGVGSLTPGFPDLTVIKHSRFILLELKDWTGKSTGLKATSMFQKAQLPFYCRNVKESVDVIHIAIKIGGCYYLYLIRTTDDVKIILDSSVGELLVESTFFHTVKELIDFISL